MLTPSPIRVRGFLFCITRSFLACALELFSQLTIVVFSDRRLDVGADQRGTRADIAVLVTSCLPKGCSRFALIDGVLVTDLACAAPLAAVVRANLAQMVQVRSAAIHKEEKLELLYRYLSGVEFRQRVEVIVDAFARMRGDLDQERRAAERQWARREKQIEAVTFNICGMYGDRQGLVPSLPSIARLELPAPEGEAA